MSYVKVKEKFASIDFDYDGNELCPVCGRETVFTFNPVKDRAITCEHCKSRILPCSLCDCDLVNCGGGKCLSKIRYVLMNQE